MKCENPKCGKEHDGSYGSGRFCCFECKQQFNQLSIKPHICKFCGSIFPTGAKLGSHVRVCKKNPKYLERLTKVLEDNEQRRNNENPIISYTLECLECHSKYVLNIRKSLYLKGRYSRFCSSQCSHSYSAKCSTEESRKKVSNTLKTKKHLIDCYECGTQMEKPICVSHALCDKCKSEHFNRRNKKSTGNCLICGKKVQFGRLTCCKEHAMQLRIASFKATQQKNKKSGGPRKGGGHGKHGWYKGYWCDSSWELAWVIYNLDHGIKFERCKEKFEYEFEGKKYNYYPDFKLENGTYVEIKGYSTSRWCAKSDQVSPKISLYVIDRQKIQMFIDYVKSKYGKDFIKLYQINL